MSRHGFASSVVLSKRLVRLAWVISHHLSESEGQFDIDRAMLRLGFIDKQSTLMAVEQCHTGKANSSLAAVKRNPTLGFFSFCKWCDYRQIELAKT
jgi:hypothetical protein